MEPNRYSNLLSAAHTLILGGLQTAQWSRTYLALSGAWSLGNVIFTLFRKSSFVFSVVFAFLCSSPSDADIVIVCSEDGADVVCIGSGSADLSNVVTNGPFSQSQAAFQPSNGVALFSPPGTTAGDGYPMTTLLSPWGSGSNRFADFRSGDGFGYVGSLIVPAGYTSGDPLSGTAIFEGESFSTMGITPGISVTGTWGTGGPGERITLSAVPEPSSFLCLGLAGVTAGAVSFFRKRQAQLSHL